MSVVMLMLWFTETCYLEAGWNTQSRYSSGKLLYISIHELAEFILSYFIFNFL